MVYLFVLYLIYFALTLMKCCKAFLGVILDNEKWGTFGQFLTPGVLLRSAPSGNPNGNFRILFNSFYLILHDMDNFLNLTSRKDFFSFFGAYQ